MFFLIMKTLMSVLLLFGCIYGYISWVKKTALKSEVAEAIKEIDETLEVHKDLPNYKMEKVRLARARLNRILGKDKK